MIFSKLKIFVFVRFFFFLSGNIRIRSNINGDIRECSRIWLIFKIFETNIRIGTFNYIRTNIIRTILRILLASIWSIENLGNWIYCVARSQTIRVSFLSVLVTSLNRVNSVPVGHSTLSWDVFIPCSFPKYFKYVWEVVNNFI